MKFGSSILIFLLAFTSASLITELNADFTDDCKALVDSVVLDSILRFMENNPVTAAAWDIFGCLQDPKIIDDMRGLCTTVGRLIPNTTEAEIIYEFEQMMIYGKYFLQKQALSLCDLCDKVDGQLSSLSEKDMEAALNWIVARTPDPKLAQAIKQQGPALMTQMLQYVLPEKTCAYLKDSCKQGITPVANDLKEAFKNATPCVECNLCNYVPFYLEKHILPNPLLPGCLTEEKDKFCILLNETSPFPYLGLDMYSTCVAVIDTFGGTLVEAIKALIEPNLLCGSMLKVCDADHDYNTIQCVCDHARFPPNFLDGILPCA